MARVHELAAEMRVPSATLLRELRAMGEFVKSASSTVEAPVVRRLRARREPAPRAAAPSPASDEGLLAWLTAGKDAAKEANERPRRQIGTGGPTPARRPKSSPPPSPARLLAAELTGTAGNRRRLDQFEAAVKVWFTRFFSSDDVRLWYRAGLGLYESHLAAACLTEGVRPGDLQTRADGVRLVERLRSGESAARVALRLRAAPPGRAGA